MTDTPRIDTLRIDTVTREDDLRAVRTLVHEFMAWVRVRYARERWLVDGHYDPDSWNAFVDSLGDVHAPPHGAILLARIGDAPAGCVMLQKVEPGICEMKRLYVAEIGRRRGVAQALCTALFTVAAQRGYTDTHLETGFRQTEAIALYERLGFERIAPYHDFPPEILAHMICMNRKLTSPA